MASRHRSCDSISFSDVQTRLPVPSEMLLTNTAFHKSGISMSEAPIGTLIPLPSETVADSAELHCQNFLELLAGHGWGGCIANQSCALSSSSTSWAGLSLAAAASRNFSKACRFIPAGIAPCIRAVASLNQKNALA